MTSPPLQQAERGALCDLLLELGPDEPTLCEGWATFDMVAHLYVREHDPVASAGIVIPAAAALHDKAIRRTKKYVPFEKVVENVRQGPPLLWKPVDAAFNTQEFFVHHEDVRRGGGDTTPRPADEIADLEATLWKNLRRAHLLMTRKIKGVHVHLDAPGFGSIHAGHGDETVTITGRPGEIVLFLLGRRGAAHVDIAGSDVAKAALDKAHLGL
jgi:uncharacterized protein (TIGR03085 family)